MSEWISVEERLPEPGTRVLITEAGIVTEAWLHRETISYWEDVNSDTRKRRSEVREWWNPYNDLAILPTHWMPLPEPPSEKE